MDARALRYLRTLVLAALLGFPIAVAALLFQSAVHHVIHIVWTDVPEELGWSEPAGWYVVLVPCVAGVLVALSLRLPGNGGHSAIEGMSVTPVAPFHLVSILPAALASLGLGLVLGPEAPLVALGLGLGVLASRFARLEGTEGRLLAVAGAFAAIAALFGGPLVAAFLMFELLALSGAIPARNLGRALLPGFVAAGTGSLVFTGIEDWPGMHQQALTLPPLPAYQSVLIADIAWCLPLALAVALVVVAVHRLAHGIAARSSPRPVAALVGAGALVGLTAVAFRALADRPVDYVLFSGQAQLPEILAETSAGILLLLLVLKGLAYALSLGAAFRGGLIFPAVTLGVVLAVAAAEVLPGLELTPAVATGIAAAVAAALRTPFSAVLFAALLIGASAIDVAPIAILAGAVGWIVAIALPGPEGREPTESDPESTGDRPPEPMARQPVDA